MSEKIKKQFGVWMDSRNAIIVGKHHADSSDFVVIAHESTVAPEKKSSENATHNLERNSLQSLFKKITSHMQNVDEIHVTGTGVAQEQFIKYLSNTPQYKNTVAKESTANKMSDEKLIEYISSQF